MSVIAASQRDLASVEQNNRQSIRPSIRQNNIQNNNQNMQNTTPIEMEDTWEDNARIVAQTNAIPVRRYEKIMQRVSLRSLMWFFILFLIAAAIVILVVWLIFWSNNSQAMDVHKITARESTVLNNALICGYLNVDSGIETRNLDVNRAFSLGLIENSNSNIVMSGKRSCLVLTNSTSTPVNVQLPLSSTVSRGFWCIIVNQGPAATFNVKPGGTDLLKNSTNTISVNTTTAIFMCLGASQTASTSNWVQLASSS